MPNSSNSTDARPMHQWRVLLLIVLFGWCFFDLGAGADEISVGIDHDAAPRVQYGASRLTEAINSIGLQGSPSSQDNQQTSRIIVGNIHSPSISAPCFVQTPRI